MALILTFATAWIGALGQTSSSQMQGGLQVSMVVYKLQANSDGSQSVVSGNGTLVPLPPPGLSFGAKEVAVYSDEAGRFWYQAINGEAIAITDPRLQWSKAPSTNSSTTNSDENKSQIRRRGALGTLLGATAGAALGTAMVSSVYNVPYGTPVYGGTGAGLYYVGANGVPVYVNPQNAAALYNQYAVQQQLVQQNRLNYQNSAQQSALGFQQQAYQNSLDYQNQKQTARTSNQQQQQQWRQSQIDNSQNLKSSNLNAAEKVNAGGRKGRFARNKPADGEVRRGSFAKREAGQDRGLAAGRSLEKTGEKASFGRRGGTKSKKSIDAGGVAERSQGRKGKSGTSRRRSR